MGMEYNGTARGSHIDLDEALPVPDGTRLKVSVAVQAEDDPPPGSLAAVMKLVGTLSDEEAEEIRKVTAEFRRVDESLWRDDP